MSAAFAPSGASESGRLPMMWRNPAAFSAGRSPTSGWAVTAKVSVTRRVSAMSAPSILSSIRGCASHITMDQRGNFVRLRAIMPLSSYTAAIERGVNTLVRTGPFALARFGVKKLGAEKLGACAPLLAHSLGLRCASHSCRHTDDAGDHHRRILHDAGGAGKSLFDRSQTAARGRSQHARQPRPR